jgi:hypothetical protein
VAKAKKAASVAKVPPADANVPVEQLPESGRPPEQEVAPPVETIGGGFTPPVSAVEAQELLNAKMETVQQPSLGRQVIYTDTDGTKRTGTVADVLEDGTCDIGVDYPRLRNALGLGTRVFKHGVAYDGAGAPCTWAWPVRA